MMAAETCLVSHSLKIRRYSIPVPKGKPWGSSLKLIAVFSGFFLHLIPHEIAKGVPGLLTFNFYIPYSFPVKS